MDKANQSSTTVLGTNWQSMMMLAWSCAALPHFLQPKTTQGQKQNQASTNPSQLTSLFS